MNDITMDDMASIVKHLASVLHDDARAAKAGYDLLMGVQTSTAHLRYKAWVRYIKEEENKEHHTDELRDGVWVPAIEYGGEK